MLSKDFVSSPFPAISLVDKNQAQMQKSRNLQEATMSSLICSAKLMLMGPQQTLCMCS